MNLFVKRQFFHFDKHNTLSPWAAMTSGTLLFDQENHKISFLHLFLYRRMCKELPFNVA